MKQPLSYQTLPCSCWVTSMINGLLCLYGDKNRIPGFVLRLLHSVLTDEGVDSGGKAKSDWEIVLEAIAEKCNLEIKSYKKEKVRINLERIDFNKAVVVCDISSGEHSVLIIKKKDDWYYGFDPDWDQVNKVKQNIEEFKVFPKVGKNLIGRVNFKVHNDHLFNERSTKNRIFAMGAVSSRNLTIMKKRENRTANK